MAVTRLTSSLLLGAALALTACGPSGNDPGPGGVSVDEAKALDEAAAMIEQRRLPPDAIVPEGQPKPQSKDTTAKGK